MAWKCPQCKISNDSSSKKCTCGYAFYEVLGLKADTPAQSVEQTYEYLIRVWKTPAGSHDTHARGKLDERVKKINEAYAVFRQISKAADSSVKNPHAIKIAIGGASVLAAVIMVIFLFMPNQKSVQPIPESVPSPTAAPEKVPPLQPAQSVTVQPAAQQSSPERKSDAPDLGADKTPEWAIESIKKSHALDRTSTVDALMIKWTQENSDRLKFIGWMAKKVDERSFLVSYTATDGVTPKGFYFEINTENGEIRNIAGNTELQQKYGVKGD